MLQVYAASETPRVHPVTRWKLSQVPELGGNQPIRSQLATVEEKIKVECELKSSLMVV